MIYNAADSPDLSSVTDMSYMFADSEVCRRTQLVPQDLQAFIRDVSVRLFGLPALWRGRQLCFFGTGFSSPPGNRLDGVSHAVYQPRMNLATPAHHQRPATSRRLRGRAGLNVYLCRP